jgi:ABC-2 type transport system ATP-binding protein
MVGLVQSSCIARARGVRRADAGRCRSVQQVVYELVRRPRRTAGAFVSSHVLSEVQRIADRVALIRDGRLELVDTVETIRQRALTHVEVTFATQPPGGVFDAVPGVHELERHGSVVRLTLEGSADQLVKALARFEVHALDSHEADLEDVFLELYRRPANAR